MHWFNSMCKFTISYLYRLGLPLSSCYQPGRYACYFHGVCTLGHMCTLPLNPVLCFAWPSHSLCLALDSWPLHVNLTQKECQPWYNYVPFVSKTFVSCKNVTSDSERIYKCPLWVPHKIWHQLCSHWRNSKHSLPEERVYQHSRPKENPVASFNLPANMECTCYPICGFFYIVAGICMETGRNRFL